MGQLLKWALAGVLTVAGVVVSAAKIEGVEAARQMAERRGRNRVRMKEVRKT